MNKYSIIYADPAWPFNNKNTGGNLKSGSVQQYPVMKLSDMMKLPVPEISEDNAVLFMWWIASQPVEAIRLVQAWGFTIKTMTGLVWIKETKLGNPFFGMGFWTRAGSECCLIAVKGNIRRVKGNVRSVFKSPIEQHSKKPDVAREMIVDLMGDLPRVELFARQETSGWDVWGNEVQNSIILP